MSDNSIPAPVPEAAPARKRLVSTVSIVLGVVGLLVLGGLIVWGIIALTGRFAAGLDTVRDLLIIILAIEALIFGVVLIIMMVMVIRLVNTIEFEIRPILEKTNETVGMVQGTTTFVSQNIVKPSITARSYIAGVRRGVRVLFGDPRRNLPP